MARARCKLAPLMAMQELVDIVQGDLLTQPAAEFRVQLFGGEEISRFCPGELLGEKLAFLLQRHKSPTATATTFPIKPSRSKGVELSQPFPYRLHRDEQQIGEAMGWQSGRVGEPDSQSSLIGILVWGFLHPGHELICREPGHQT